MSKQSILSDTIKKCVKTVMSKGNNEWTHAEHSAMIRYLLVECSNMAGALPGTVKDSTGKEVKGLVKDGKLVTECLVDLTKFRSELNQPNVFEQSNFKKRITDDYPVLKTDKKTADYE